MELAAPMAARGEHPENDPIGLGLMFPANYVRSPVKIL
jgi:hypothetical protein